MNITIAQRHKYAVFTDTVFCWGVCLALGSACISHLRLTPHGPAIVLEGGYPFVYEFGVAIVLIALFSRLGLNVPKLNHMQLHALVGMCLFYAPIFLNYVLRSSSVPRLDHHGEGQLRLQMDVWLLGIAVIVYPMSEGTVRKVLYVIVIMAVANCVYTIVSQYGLLQPMYERAARSPDRIRYSGFLEMPSRSGVLAAVATAWALWLSPGRLATIAILCVCVAAVVIADSRTAMVAILITGCARMLVHFKMQTMIKVVILLCIGLICPFAIYIVPSHVWIDNATRLVSIHEAAKIWSRNPLGVPWGTFEHFNRNPLAVSPHNWPAIALLYGGVLSFAAVVVAHVWLLHTYISIQHRKKTDKLSLCLLFVLITLTVAAWFEQVLQQASASLIYVFVLGSLVHRLRLQSPTQTTQRAVGALSLRRHLICQE